MTTSTTTRRALLAASAAVPLAAIPALALAAPGDDARLVQLYAEWCAILREEAERKLEYDRIDALIPDWAKPGDDQKGRNWGWPDLRSSPEWERLFAGTGVSWRASEAEVLGHNLGAIVGTERGTAERRRAEAEASERLQVVIERMEAKDREYASSGMTAHVEASEALYDRLYAVEDEIEATPAQGLAGLLVKVRVAALVHWSTQPDEALPEETDDEGARDKLLPSLARDIERLAGRASSA